MKTDFVVVGRTRNIPKILQVFEMFKRMGKTYYCFATSEKSHQKVGLNLEDHPDKLADDYESCGLDSEKIRTIFHDDLEGLKSVSNLLIALTSW